MYEKRTRSSYMNKVKISVFGGFERLHVEDGEF